ncbi:hypothetical protein AMTR_s00075p00160680 [Amborella trichopoda]|uniref:Uncharacterized protein n=1 Tax=Amborella trichopoda TaxID=13333 RepID=W1P3Z7_AMBTC|nr:hypothetical protein AMTR_s00075p00160680 [Amborella trichopoda]
MVLFSYTPIPQSPHSPDPFPIPISTILHWQPLIKGDQTSSSTSAMPRRQKQKPVYPEWFQGYDSPLHINPTPQSTSSPIFDVSTSSTPSSFSFKCRLWRILTPHYRITFLPSNFSLFEVDPNQSLIYQYSSHHPIEPLRNRDSTFKFCRSGSDAPSYEAYSKHNPTD